MTNTDVQALRESLETYRQAADQLRKSISDMARAREARDILRAAERDLEKARVKERAAREKLTMWRVLALVFSTLGGML